MLFAHVAFLVAIMALFPAQARAHLSLTSPTSRYGPDVLKTGPCGKPGGERSENVTYYEPGETIEVRWNEYVDHPGHYRIAFDDDGDDDFIDPPLDHFVNPPSMMGPYSNDTVLLDGITDMGPGQRDYMATVTLPDVTCDNCTLQVIQVMTDKDPFTIPGDDIYYQCADLVLRSGGTPPDAGTNPGTDAGTNRDAGTDTGAVTGGGCSAVPGAEAGLGMMPLFLILAAWRLARRRRLPV